MMDVATACQTLWDKQWPLRYKRALAETLGLSLPLTRRYVACWVGLHDLGKASPAFQVRWPHGEPPISACVPGALFTNTTLYGDAGNRHSDITTQLLRGNHGLLVTQHGLPPTLADDVAYAVGAHHGYMPSTPLARNAPNAHAMGIDDATWVNLQLGLLTALSQHCGVTGHWPGGEGPSKKARAWWLIRLMALTTLSDWLGSDKGVCPVTPPPVSPRYATNARRALQRRVGELFTCLPVAPPRSFDELFGFTPRPLQQAVLDLLPTLPSTPGLFILEAPMGVGKTEAAFLLLARYLQQGYVGAYMALPTQASSNQLLGRFKLFLQRLYGEHVPTALLHGNASLMDIPSLGAEEDEWRFAHPAATTWFAGKRGLLAPFGVGTVDQVLTGVVKSKHFFLRLGALSHKVLIVDEVHAYDTYTLELLCLLLRYQRGLHVTVLLLSATLPTLTREQLITAYAGDAQRVPTPPVYPALTWWHAGGTGTVQPAQATSHVELRWLALGDVAATLKRLLHQGGCALLLVNTVREAQHHYLHLRQQGWSVQELGLFHARYPYEVRAAKELQVLTYFGKEPGQRPARYVLVATQVVEQSLDLDFDVIITDLAPIDLVLQRMGRMHRHTRIRPAPLRAATLYVLEPPLSAEGLQLNRGSTFVYERFLLLKSWWVLQGLTQVTLPHDLSRLVEMVYSAQHPLPSNLPTVLHREWEGSLRAWQTKNVDRSTKAYVNTIPNPSARLTETLSGEFYVEDNDDEYGVVFNNITRLSASNTMLVCLDASNQHLQHGNLQRPQVQRLLQRFLGINRPDLVELLARHCSTPPAWRQVTRLAHAHPVVFDAQGQAHHGNVVFKLSPELGLVVTKLP